MIVVLKEITKRMTSMPLTVNTSFTNYRSEFVDLDADEVKTARKSRDYLLDQIKAIAKDDSSFPSLYSGGSYKSFGSFARRTKVRPLNDIDLLMLLTGKGTKYSEKSQNVYKISVDETNPALMQLTNDDGSLNSTRVLNRFKTALALVSNYSKAEIKRNGVAVVLKLKSYDWAFDIVPSFPATAGDESTAFYLIPNGNGEWMRTDPRIDQNLITEVNQKYEGLVLPVLRLIKYWNTERHSPPTIPSYYLEMMLVNTLRYSSATFTSIKFAIPVVFHNLHIKVMTSCPDPKGLGANLETGVSLDTRQKVSKVALDMFHNANWALEYENRSDHKTAISYWSNIFPGFPTYG